MGEQVLEVTDGNFESEVLKAGTPALVDFWAEWCQPCHMVSPLVEEMAQEYAGRLKVGKVNVDNNTPTATRFHVMNIPTLILFKGGQEVDRVVGAVSKGELVKRIEKVL